MRLNSKFWTALVLFFGAIIILPTTIFSGLEYCSSAGCMIHYWGAHEHDGIWHLAVVNVLLGGMGQVMPTLSGQMLSGYNTVLDWLLAALSTLTRITPSIWYFQILPILWFICFGYLLFIFAKKYKAMPSFAPLLLFFSFFGSSFAYLITLKNTGTIWGSSSLLSMQSALVLLNPQLALSLLCVIGYLILTLNKAKNTKTYLIYSVLAALSLGLKFYTGVILLFMMAWELLLTYKEERNFTQLIKRGTLTLIFPVLVGLVVYAPSGQSFPLIWKPFATVNPIIEEKSLVYIGRLASSLYSESGVRLILIEIGITILFVVMNLGTRIMGVIGLISSKKKNLSITESVIWAGAILGTFCSIVFVQRGIWWNTVQFLHVALFLWGIISAIGVANMLSSKQVGYIALGWTIVALSIPQNLDIIKTYYRYPGTSVIYSAEVEALEHLKSLPPGVVYTPPFAPNLNPKMPPELAEIHDTAYVTAYSGQITYLSDTTQLELLSLPYQERLNLMKTSDCRIMDEVSYLYERADTPYLDQFEQCSAFIQLSFENETVRIYRVN